jgi:hypothetical protein
VRCVFLDAMLFRAEFYGLGHARTGKICGNTTFQDGGTFMGCDSNKSTDKFMHEDNAC